MTSELIIALFKYPIATLLAHRSPHRFAAKVRFDSGSTLRLIQVGIPAARARKQSLIARFARHPRHVPRCQKVALTRVSMLQIRVLISFGHGHPLPALAMVKVSVAAAGK